MPIGKIIKEGAKLVKRGRKSKRGRPKKKVEVKKKQVVKRTDPYKITRLKGESDAAFKKRKAAIKKEVRESARETSKDQIPPKTSGGARDELGRLLSKHIPPSRKEMSKAQFRRLVKQGLIGVTEEGKVKNIGKFADIPENVMKELRGYARKITKEELEELARMGITARKEGSKVGKKSKDKKKDKFHKKGIPFPTPKGINKTIDTLLNPIKAKTGGVVKRKTGGPIGVGKALRGYGKGYK
jgi:hypothetical protein